MLKKLFFFAVLSTLCCAVHAKQEAVWTTAESLEALGLSYYDAAELAARTVLAEGEYGTFKVAYADNYKIADIRSNYVKSVKVNGVEYALDYGITGSTNPVDVSIENEPTGGCVYQIDAKKDGWIVVFGKLSSNKPYYVWENNKPVDVPGIPPLLSYTLSMNFQGEVCSYTLPGNNEDNWFNMDLTDAEKYSDGQSLRWPEKIFLGYDADDVKMNGFGCIMFPVYATCSYLIHSQGSKMNTNGFIFTEDKPISIEAIVPETIDAETGEITSEATSFTLYGTPTEYPWRTSLGETGNFDFEDGTETILPKVRDILVKDYDDYVVIDGFMGVKGYGLKVGWNEDGSVVSYSSIVDGVESTPVTSGYLTLPTGRDDVDYYQPYIGENYSYIWYDEDDQQTGNLLLWGYWDNEFTYYYLSWPQSTRDIEQEITDDSEMLENLIVTYRHITQQADEYPDFVTHKGEEIEVIGLTLDEITEFLYEQIQNYNETGEYESPRNSMEKIETELIRLQIALDHYEVVYYQMQDDWQHLLDERDLVFEFYFYIYEQYPDFYNRYELELDDLAASEADLYNFYYRAVDEYWVTGEYERINQIIDIVDERLLVLNAVLDAYLASLEETGVPIDAADLAALVAVQNELESSFYWLNTWNLTGTETRVGYLEGVTIEDGKVTGIDLSNKGLSGLFPTTLLSLPNVTSIDLTRNYLSGDIGTAMMALMRQNPTLTAKITTLNLGSNAYTGNVGLLARCFPNLKRLDVAYNQFSDLAPALAETIEIVYIDHQTIDKTIDLDRSNISMTQIATQLPTIILYDTEARTFRTGLNLMCTDSPEGSFSDDGTTWIVQLSYADNKLEMPYVSSQNSFKGNSGDRLSVINLYPDNTVEGSTFYIRFYFQQGDANFDGAIDIRDVQSIILKAFDEYPADRPYNFTASNLYIDDVINVQDVVVIVDLIAAQTPATNAAQRLTAKDADAQAYTHDGQLYISSAVPIAAFDVTVLGDIAGDLPVLRHHGFDYRIVRTGAYTRIIAYSLTGATLPAGVTTIAEADGQGVAAAMLSDAQAQQITESAGASALDSVNADLNVLYDNGTLRIATADATLTWAVYGLDGTLIAQGTQATADISAVPAGCYIVTVKTETAGLQSTKIIIKK